MEATFSVMVVVMTVMVKVVSLAVLTPPCPSCESIACAPTPICGGTLVKDRCGCCDICQLHEGERCVIGKDVCAPGFVCDSRGRKTFLVPAIGYCQSEQCARVRCGRRQLCVLVDGEPQCVCRTECPDTYTPFCSEDGTTEFPNLCYLQKRECLTDSKIDALPGRCPERGTFEVCETPVVAGPCYALMQAYFFNVDTQKCEQFEFGGCDITGGVFDTMLDCKKTCEWSKRKP